MMPEVSVAGGRCALGWLVAGAVGGVLIALQRLGVPVVALPLQGHWHWLIFGWMTQFALSIAWWILPRSPGGRRGSAARPVVALTFLNGAQIVALARPWEAALLELLAVALYGSALLPRVALRSPQQRAARRAVR